MKILMTTKSNVFKKFVRNSNRFKMLIYDMV